MNAINERSQTIAMSYSAGSLHEKIIAETLCWQTENKTQRFWNSDATLWTNSDESKWMGWLDVMAEQHNVASIDQLAAEIHVAGFTDIVLMGMGGSSLCPDMMARTFGQLAGFPRLHILDSTDPLQIFHLEQKINLKKSFFIVSSKSGSTLEPNIFFDYFYARLQALLNKTEVGDCFIAITDPDTKLEKLAREKHFKTIFHGVPSIGGRYSALTNFGMVPSGIMGVNIKVFLQHAESMRNACSPETPAQDNPGVLLGIILGVCATHGKDKVTLVASPGIHALGAWLEQLLAESTGKNGKGLIPVDQESLGAPHVYGDDRIFVYIRLESAPDLKQDKAVDVLESAGFVVVRLNLSDIMHLGAELFRWEIATDVAGSILKVNPFNQPDVEESKVLSLKLTDQYEKTGELEEAKPFFSEHGISLYTDEKNAERILRFMPDGQSLAACLQAHLHVVQLGDYVDLSAFIEMTDENTALLQVSREIIRNQKKVATCLGFGPRFLHSTGQAYKGGPNTGVFIQITADHQEDLPIPGHKFTFGIVIAAQAQADYSVLVKRERRVLRIHLGSDVKSGLQRLQTLVLTD